MKKRINHEPAATEPPDKKTRVEMLDLKPGTILTDILGKKWKLGRTIGTGGFGMIYLVSDSLTGDVKTDVKYVAKIESHTSGALFVERNCYLNVAKPEMISEWKETSKIEHLGMPHYIASGSHVTKTNKYRFLIIPKFERDLEEIFELKKRKFNLKTVITITLQTLDVLEYIHSKGYVHSDIKASNILLETSKAKSRLPVVMSVPKINPIRYHGCTPVRSCKIRKLQTTRPLRPNMNLRYVNVVEETYGAISAPPTKPSNIDRVYLLDYGLAAKYLSTQGEHKHYCTDVRKAHAGTITFCARDAHLGAQSRRSDLECLGYNVIHWLTSNLPWAKDCDCPETVYQQKKCCIDNLKDFLDWSFNYQCPHFLLDYFNYIKGLEFTTKPNYDYCKGLFKKALSDYGYKDNLLLDFDSLEGWGRKQKKTKPKSSENNFKVKPMMMTFTRSPLRSNFIIKISVQMKPTLRKKMSKTLKRKLKWSKILDPEVIMKKAKSRERKLTELSESNPTSPIAMSVDEFNQLNPTMAMKEVFNKCRGRAYPRGKGDAALVHLDGYTSAMMQVHNRKRERVEMELEEFLISTAKVTRRAPNKKAAKKRGPKKHATIKKSKSVVSSPPCTRLKTRALAEFIKEHTKSSQTKSVPIRKTYSLRG